MRGQGYHVRPENLARPFRLRPFDARGGSDFHRLGLILGTSLLLP